MLDVRLTKEVRDQYQRGFFLALLQFLHSICIISGLDILGISETCDGEKFGVLIC